MQTRLLTFLALSIACANAPAADSPVIGKDDLLWLNRITYGADDATMTQFRALGRKKFLDVQLRANDEHLPAPIQQRIDAMAIAHVDLRKTIEDFAERRKELKADGKDELSAEQKKEYVREGADLVRQTINRELLRAVYSPDQLKEQMVWFWLNQFNVFARKGAEPWLVSDYAEHAIRPYAMGKFRDLVMATLTHPAMLVYLDNVRNAKDHANENYARELMELHTLGVGSGYTQQDVQQLALILTGAGVAPLREPNNMRPRVAEMVVRNGMFEFNPKRHDFSDKVLLGHKIKGSGFDEISEAVDLITKQPACAQFISKKLAEYFVSDTPSPELVAKMAHTFERTDGDIAEVLHTMLDSKELAASYGKKFKDPMQFVVSSVRMAYDGKPIANAKPLLNWLNQLGEPVFGRLTPDGWPLDSAGWSSSGQMAKRFEIAGAIGTGNNRLLTPEGQPKLGGDFPMLTTRLYYDTFDTKLSTPTRDALAKATTQQEWNTFLLSSPDFNYR